jgi:site-specific DNA-adenine methylase
MALNPLSIDEKNPPIHPLWSYPGSKMRATHIIWPYIKGQTKVVSPFLGSGALEINLAHKGIQVIGYDYFDLLADLWVYILNDNENLFNKIEELALPLRTLDYPKFNVWWKKEWKNLPTKPKGIEKTALFYMLQSSSHSVRLGSQSASSSRYKSMLKRKNILNLKYFNQPNLKFGGQLSFEESIAKHPQDFLYLDPPYLLDDKNNKLYGYNGEMHKGFDHQLLSDILHTRSNWIMSYNSCDKILELYEDKKIIKLDWTYSMSKTKECNEILIIG